MIYGYARVSSKGQEKGGNSLEFQEKTLLEHKCDIVYKETYTGTTINRPVLNKIIDNLQESDTLMVTKLDRFARASEGAALMENLVNKGVIVEILNMGRADNTPMGKLMINILVAFAQYERDMIVERFNEGKLIAKSKGKKINGRNKVICPDFPEYYQKQKSGLMTVKKCCDELNISRSTWYNLVKDIS